MLRGPKCLTPWVDLRYHQYPENGLLAGFTTKTPFEVSKNRGNKIGFYLYKKGQG